MTRQVWFGTVNDVSPQWYNVSNWVPKLTEGKEVITQKANAYGQWQNLDMDDVWSERDGAPIPVDPMAGMEVMYLDYNAGSPLLSKYYFGGRINAVFPRSVVENKRWKVECDGPEEDFNTVLPHMAFYQATIGNDSARVAALFQAAINEFGLKGTWDLVTQIGGPFISYEAGSYNEYDLKTLGFILADIAADPGQPGDTGYKVPARRYYVSCEWNDPANPGTGGAAAMVRVLHYYSAELAAVEPIPLTDRPDQHAFYAYDAFARVASASAIGIADTGQVWAALIGTFGIDGTQRAYMSAHVGEDIAVVEGNTADGDVSVTFDTKGSGQRLAFRITSNPATGYKWQGFIVENNANTSYIVKRYQAGSYTTLGTIVLTPANGDIIKATLLGSSIKIYVNGVLRGTYTDTFNQTATLHGIGANAAVGMKWDQFGVWARGALYWNMKPAIDRTAMINIVTIAGPGSEPQPVGWQNEQGAKGQNDGDLTKTDGTDAWDSGGTSKQEITEDGASVTATVEEVMKVQDGFNRTDNAGTLGVTESGQTWNVLGSDAVWGIESNRAAPKSGTGAKYAYTDTGVSTAIVQSTFAVVVAGQRLLFRMSDASNLWYLEAQAASYKIYKRVAGVDTLMSTYAVTPANGDVVKVSLTDNIIKFYLNGGGPFATITDAFNQYATKHGIGTSTSFAPRFDDFTVWQTYTTMAFGMGPDATFAASAEDNFDRADSATTMGSAQTGQAWSVLGTAAVWGIQSNTAYQVSGSGTLYAYLNTLIADGIMQVALDTVATGARVLFRMSDASNLWYIEAQAASYKVYKRVAGVETLMATYAATPANGDIIKVALDGANIKVYVNGTGPLAVVSDAFNQTATKHGIGVSGASAARFNDFSMWPPYWKTIPFAWLIQAASRTAQPSEMGTLVGTPYTYTEGDRFKVAVRPVVTDSGGVVNQVRYYVNDQQKFLSSLSPSPTADVPFYAQGAVYNAGATLSNVTIKLLSYTTVTDDASVQLWGPKPAKDVVHRDDLDTRVKRQALGDAIVGRHGTPRITVPLDTLQEYHEGRIVLINNEKQGWQNLRIMVATAQRKVKTSTVLYSLQLGETDIEYGDEEPLGLLMKPQLFDNTGPDKPAGLAAAGGVRDGEATVAENFTWNRPTNDARTIHLLITQVGGPTGDVHPLPAQTGKGTIYGLKPATAYTVRAKYEDWNGNFSEYTSPAVPFTTPQIIVATFTISLASNTYDRKSNKAQIQIDRTSIIGINIVRYYLEVTETIGAAPATTREVDFNMATRATFLATCAAALTIVGYAISASGQRSNPTNILTPTAHAADKPPAPVTAGIGKSDGIGGSANLYPYWTPPSTGDIDADLIQAFEISGLPTDWTAPRYAPLASSADTEGYLPGLPWGVETTVSIRTVDVWGNKSDPTTVSYTPRVLGPNIVKYGDFDVLNGTTIGDPQYFMPLGWTRGVPSGSDTAVQADGRAHDGRYALGFAGANVAPGGGNQVNATQPVILELNTTYQLNYDVIDEGDDHVNFSLGYVDDADPIVISPGNPEPDGLWHPVETTFTTPSSWGASNHYLEWFTDWSDGGNYDFYYRVDNLVIRKVLPNIKPSSSPDKTGTLSGEAWGPSTDARSNLSVKAYDKDVAVVVAQAASGQTEPLFQGLDSSGAEVFSVDDAGTVAAQDINAGGATHTNTLEVDSVAVFHDEADFGNGIVANAIALQGALTLDEIPTQAAPGAAHVVVYSKSDDRVWVRAHTGGERTLGFKDEVVGSITGTTPINVGGTTTTPVISIDAASGSGPGSMSAANFTKLAGVATGATANQTDAYLLDRAHHTGTQLMATVSDAGGAATKNVGTTAGTVAAGDDSRITGAAQKASNLSDLASASTARTNLGLGTSAIKDVAASGNASSTQVVKGDDTRLTDSRTPTAHATTHELGGTDAIRLDQLALPTADVSINSHKLTNVTDPASAQDAATKAYVDAIAQGMYWKQTARAAASTNLTLTAPGGTIDGVTMAAGDRVLLMAQTTGSQNGLYIWNGASSTMTRSTDADVSAEVKSGMSVWISEGTKFADSAFTLTTNDPITLGTTTLTFTQFSGLGQVTAGSGITKLGNTLSADTTIIATKSYVDTQDAAALAALPIQTVYFDAETTAYTVASDPTSDTTVKKNNGTSDMTFTIVLTATKNVMFRFFCNFTKSVVSTGRSRFRIYDGASIILPNGGSRDGFNSTVAVDDEQNVFFEGVVSLASGSHVITVKHQATYTTAAITLKERSLIAEVLN